MSKNPQQILCPFDLNRFTPEPQGEDDDGVHCPRCRQRLPEIYLQEGLNAPVDVVMCMGRTGNGKTTLLMSMFGTFITRPGILATAVGTYAPPSADEATSVTSWAREAFSKFASHGILPESSLNVARPVPLYVLDPPGGDRRNLFLFDAGGETFDTVADLAGNMPYTASARVLWIVVSLGRGRHEETMEEKYSGLGGNLWDLLDTYVNARAEIRRDLNLPVSPQALLVIFTKADAHEGRIPELDAHLERDAISTPEERIVLSDLLRNWLATNTEGGAGAIARAERQFEEVEFCAVSATGGSVVETDDERFRTVVRPKPKLILDPMAWTWELTERLERRSSIWGRVRRKQAPRAWVQAKAAGSQPPWSSGGVR